MDKKEVIILVVVAIVLTIAIGIIFYLVTKDKDKKSNTGGEKTVQDYVDGASALEIQAAKKMIDSFSKNINGLFSQYMCEEMLNYSDAQLAWAATYYDEQTGRNLTSDIKDMTYLGWTSFSFSDNELVKRLQALGIE